nr:hypothetical protein [Tanacetum cinerariifolium]
GLAPQPGHSSFLSATCGAEIRLAGGGGVFLTQAGAGQPAPHQLGLQASVAQSVTQIVSAYRELLKAQEQLRIVSDALGRSHEQLKVNDALIAAGRMARVDRLQNEADL